MKAFYGLMLETTKEERTYQFNAPIGVQFDEVKEVLDLFKSMIIEMAEKALEKEAQDKQLPEVEVELVEPITPIKEDDGTTS
jgi:hypothetical protein